MSRKMSSNHPLLITSFSILWILWASLCPATAISRSGDKVQSKINHFVENYFHKQQQQQQENGTAATSHHTPAMPVNHHGNGGLPPSYYDSRDPRQWAGNAYTGGYGGGGIGGLAGYGISEMVLIGILCVIGIGILGFPFLILFLTLFNGSGFGVTNGLNFIPPTTQTTVTNGRKRRATTAGSLFEHAEVIGKNPKLQEKLFEVFNNFMAATDKVELIKKLFKD